MMHYHPPLRFEGGDNMEIQKYEEGVCCRFDCYCKKVLKYRLISWYREMKRRNEREASFFELSGHEMARLVKTDEYFKYERTFSVLGESISISDDEPAKALNMLPADRRKIILMKYFLGMSDRKISERLNIARSTVSYQRNSSLRKLKTFMESEV
jgi:RNA polymerase sigma factor (sigma-70 family)